MKKGIIFDLDGTLINSLPDIANAMNRSLKKCGLPAYEIEEYKMKIGDGVINLAKRAVADRTDCLDQVLAYYMEDYAVNCRVDSHVYDGIHEALEGLIARELKVCVLSNKDQKDVESVVRYYFPEIPFAYVAGRIRDIPLKPDPAGALRIAEKLAIAPEDFWYVGDTLMDMRCGNAAHMETIGVSWGFRPRKDLEDNHARHIIDMPSQLLSVIDGH